MERQSSTISNGSSKVKLLCSYGGKIQPRPSDHHLSYFGGETKILAVDPNVNFSEILAKLISLAQRNESSEVSIKYQLPGEDLDALVSLINDEDVEHMMVEYSRMQRISTKPVRLRIFIFDKSGPMINPTAKASGLDLPLNPDYLFGFDKEYQPSVGPPLDLLQIPGMFEETAGNHTSSRNGATDSSTETAVSYRVPALGNGGAYHNLQYMFVPGPCMVSDSREQAVYSFVPIMPSIPEQKMIVSGGNNQPMRVNQAKF
ncbi:uncharacterized protein [Primulina huaijiensis]|uniref:uncharacterized protein n=1 Tax=Primulina huaijiensis TaxID=1492673 RepID=UPI003CC7975B